MARTPASVADHPIHPMLVAFPIGLFVFSLICDLIFRSGGAPLWNDMAFYGDFLAEYERVSEDLFQKLIIAIAAATNQMLT